jgi:poly-gamma-glutamate synthesis protein (capsule biosynthesis protein)
MLFLGDMMFDREVRNRMARSNDPLYPFDAILGTEERFFRGQDIVIGNLEGPVSSVHAAPEKENDFAFDPSVAKLLSRVGIGLVSQANNHTLDQGRAIAESSRSAIESAGVSWVGDQTRENAGVSVRHLSLRGQNVAVLAFNITDHPFDKEGAKSAFDSVATSTYRVVYIHWGNEYQDHPSSVQVELAHWFIDQGASAVIGTHPHWMQSVETYRGKIIAYSLGNFIFDQDWSIETQNGLAVGLVLGSNESSLHLFPISIIKSHPVLLTGDARQSRLDHLAEISDASLADQIRSGVLKVGE